MCIAVAATGGRHGNKDVPSALIVHRITEFINFDYDCKQVLVSLDFYIENQANIKRNLLFVHRGTVDAHQSTQAWLKNPALPEECQDPLCLRTISFHLDWSWKDVVVVPSKHGDCRYKPSTATPALVVGENDGHRPYSLFELGPFDAGSHSICRVSFVIKGEPYEYLLDARPRFAVEGAEIVVRKILQNDMENCRRIGNTLYTSYKTHFDQFHRLWEDSMTPLRYEVVLWANHPSLLPKIAKPIEMRELKPNPNGCSFTEDTIWLIAPEVNKFQIRGTVASGDFVVCML